MRPPARTAHPNAGRVYDYGYYGTAYCYSGHSYYAVRVGEQEQSTSTAAGGSATRH